MELESEISKVNDLQLQNDSSGRYDGTHKTQLLFIPNQHNEHMNEYRLRQQTSPKHFDCL